MPGPRRGGRRVPAPVVQEVERVVARLAVQHGVPEARAAERAARGLEVLGAVLDEQDGRSVPVDHHSVPLPQREEDRGALTRRRFDPDAAVVPLDDLAHDREPGAGAAAELVAAVQPLEDPEHVSRWRSGMPMPLSRT